MNILGKCNNFISTTDIYELYKITRNSSYYYRTKISHTESLNAEYVIPVPFDPRVGKTVAEAVAKAPRDSGVARV